MATARLRRGITRHVFKRKSTRREFPLKNQDQSTLSNESINIFIGERPGEVELVLKIPFIGPTSASLNYAISSVKKSFYYDVINVVDYIPLNLKGNGRSPNEEEIKKEVSGIEKFLSSIQNVGTTFLMGNVPKQLTRHINFKNKIVETVHPAFISRLEFPLYETKKLTKIIEENIQ